MQEWPLTAGEYEVSGSLSSPSRGTFHLSLTVLVHYRSLKFFSLGGWSPQLPTRVLVPRGTQDASPALPLHRYGVLTLSDGAFQHLRVRSLAFVLVLQPQLVHRPAGLSLCSSSSSFPSSSVLPPPPHVLACLLDVSWVLMRVAASSRDEKPTRGLCLVSPLLRSCSRQN